MTQKDENSNNVIIPNNFVQTVYSKSTNKMKNIQLDNRYKNYLKLNYQIFQSQEEFQKCFYEMKDRINDFFIYILNKNYRKYEIDTDPNEVQEEENKLIKIEEIEEKKKDLLEELIKKNIFLNIYYKNIIKKNRMIKEYNINNNGKNNLRNLNKLLLESVFNSNAAENIKLKYNFNLLKSQKKYKIKGAYIYHTLMKNILEIYKACPDFIINQHTINLEEFKFRINNFNSFIQSSNHEIISNETYFLLYIYESAVLYILTDYTRLKNNEKDIKIFNTIKNNVFNNRKRDVFKFRMALEKKVKNSKLEKICEKQNKKIIRRQNIYFPDIYNIKLKRNKSQETIFQRMNNSNINSVNFDYSLLKY